MIFQHKCYRATKSPQFLIDGEPNYTTFSEDIHPSLMLPEFVLDIRYIALFWTSSVLQSKIRPNFDIFDPL